MEKQTENRRLKKAETFFKVVLNKNNQPPTIDQRRQPKYKMKNSFFSHRDPFDAFPRNVRGTKKREERKDGWMERTLKNFQAVNNEMELCANYYNVYAGDQGPDNSNRDNSNCTPSHCNNEVQLYIMIMFMGYFRYSWLLCSEINCIWSFKWQRVVIR